MENYIGKDQIIPVKNIKLTVVEQKNDKLLIELEDGRYFKSTIENWDKGFTKLNHLSSPLNIVGETAINKDGRKMEENKEKDQAVEERFKAKLAELLEIAKKKKNVRWLGRIREMGLMIL